MAYHAFECKGLPATPHTNELAAEELLKNLRSSLGASAAVEEAALAALTHGSSLEAPCPIAPPPLGPAHAGTPGAMSARRRGKKGMSGVAHNPAWWDACQRPQASLDCVELLRATPQVPSHGHLPAQSLPPQKTQHHGLNADAVEFVHTGAFAVNLPMSSTVKAATTKVQSEGGETPRAKGEQPHARPDKKTGSDDATGLAEHRLKLEASIKSILTCSAEVPSPSSSPTCIAVAPEDLPADIPSVGSLGHEKGECRRCNFFHKGRCQNGRSCSFCHFPHEKRKPGRRDSNEPQEEQMQAGVAMQAELCQEWPSCVKAPPGLVLAEAAVQPQTGRVVMKASFGTQTEDDMLPGCSLCGACASGAEVKMPEPKVRFARLGGC